MQYEPLTHDDEATLSSEREYVPAVVEAHFPEAHLYGDDRDLSMLQRVLESAPYTDDPVGEVVALGTALGDLIAHELGMSWVRFSDEEGVDLALRYQDTSIVVFPRSMILKRLEREEDPDIPYLYGQVCAAVREMLSEGNYQ